MEKERNMVHLRTKGVWNMSLTEVFQAGFFGGKIGLEARGRNPG